MITRGTTPKLKFLFRSVDVSEMAVAYLTVEQGDLVIEKDLSQAEIGDGYIEWELSQEETLQIGIECNLKIQCRWKLDDGTTGASPINMVSPYQILKDGEI